MVESANAATFPSLLNPLSFPLSFPFPPPPPLSLPPSLHFLQPAWFLMVGGDRSFKLALIEKDKEFSDELREDCEVRGMERERGAWGQGGGSQSVRWFHPLTLIACVLEWKCPVSRAKGVFLLSLCVCPPLTTTGGPPSCPLHAGPS